MMLLPFLPVAAAGAIVLGHGSALSWWLGGTVPCRTVERGARRTQPQRRLLGGVDDRLDDRRELVVSDAGAEPNDGERGQRAAVRAADRRRDRAHAVEVFLVVHGVALPAHQPQQRAVGGRIGHGAR